MERKEDTIHTRNGMLTWSGDHLSQIGNCRMIYPEARFNFASQLSDDNIWTVSVTRSVDGIRDVFLEASGNTIDICFDELLRKSSRATSHHVNARGFDFPQKVHIEPETAGESDSDDCDAEATGTPVNRAEALVTDDEDWGDDGEDCGGPAAFVSLVPAQPSSPRRRTGRPHKSTHSRRFAPLASLASASSPPPPPSPRPPPPPPPSSAGEKVHYDDPPPPPPPSHMRSSRLASSTLEAKVSMKPMAVSLDITLAQDSNSHVFLTKVLPSQQAIEEETLHIIEQKQLDSHIEYKNDATKRFTITGVNLGTDPNERHELLNFGDDLSALFNSCGNTIPRFFINMEYESEDS